MATTVILIRHADKDVPQLESDPSLNDRGMARARELVHILSTAGIQAIYTSQAKRAKMTAKPFFQAQLSLSITLPLVRLNSATELRDDILTHREGQTVLVVGHANTVPELIGQLGGPSLAEINDCVFDDFFVLVRRSATEVSLTTLKYGEPTPPCQS
jgi:broad specificity phosphatase PhoE